MKYLTPTPEDAQKWANALRSGKYKQTENTLQDGNGYCCLGVACDVFIRKSKQKRSGQTNFLFGLHPDDQPAAPGWLKTINSDFRDIMSSGLASLNDNNHYSFNEIADLIELVYVHKAL